MTMQTHEKITIVLPTALIEEVAKIKKERNISINFLYQTAITEYVEKINRQKLRQEAQEMVREYENNLEMVELFY